MNKIEVVAALYKNKAKEVLVSSVNDYEFLYKNIKVHMSFTSMEIVFVAKKMGKKEQSKLFTIKRDKDFSYLMKKAFSQLDMMLVENKPKDGQKCSKK